MENDSYAEHPLDSLLDSESEREFGEIQIKSRFDHDADESVSGNLKNWTAQDFASMHNRFRPHLERHAKRYLSNPVQAEEVVQDAFLYLMTTLPELDTELGVLKFLKWKIRLLSYDILRSASRQRETSVREHDEYPSEADEFTAELERAEDNAVIRMALAKLNPRQREALVASVYEEKSSEEVAEQLGLSPNAARQLLFRARSAFRKALVGEAETQGKNISQILSIAVRKAALDAKENALKVGAFIVLTAFGIGALPNLLSSGELVIAQAPANETVDSTDLTLPLPMTQSETSDPSTRNGPDQNIGTIDEGPNLGEPARYSESFELPERPSANSPAAPIPLVDQRLTDQSLSGILATDVTTAGIYMDKGDAPFGIIFQGPVVEVFGGTGISAFLDLNVQSRAVRQIIFQISVDGERFFGVARNIETEELDNGDGYTIAIVSKDFLVVDDQSNVLSDSPLAASKAVVTLELAEDGSPQSASLKVESLG